MANATNPMQGVVFDGVVVNDAKAKDFCGQCSEGVAGGIATGGTHPVPPCFATNGTASATERRNLRAGAGVWEEWEQDSRVAPEPEQGASRAFFMNNPSLYG